MIPKTPDYYQLQSSVPLRNALADVLENETLKAAIAAVKACAAPRYMPMLTPGLHPDTSTAHTYHMMAGVHEAFAMLEQLTHPPQSRIMADEAEYHHTLPRELREAPSHLE